jgi:transposase
MGRVSRAIAHLDKAAVEQKLQTLNSDWQRYRWLIVYQALVQPKPAPEIAQSLGVSVALVHKVISQYNRIGVVALETPGKGGRRNCYLSLRQEQEFLEKLGKKVVAGERLTTDPIKQAYEQQLGHRVHKTTIYRLLERHGWRRQEGRIKQ